MKIKHAKVSGMDDTQEPELIQPSDWNHEHLVVEEEGDAGHRLNALVAGGYGVGSLANLMIAGAAVAVGGEVESTGANLGCLAVTGGAAIYRPAGERWRFLGGCFGTPIAAHLYYRVL